MSSTLMEMEAACHRLIAENDRLRAFIKKVAKVNAFSCVDIHMLTVEAVEVLKEEE